MKLEIIKRIEEKVVVDIVLPYYYKHDLMLEGSDAIVYGKIEQDKSTRITIAKWYGLPGQRGEREYEFAVNYAPAAHYSDYLTEKMYRSSEKEFLAAKAKMLKAVNG